MKKSNISPVIMLTAKAQSDDLTRTLELGATDYIAKPFNPPILLDKVKKIISPCYML